MAPKPPSRGRIPTRVSRREFVSRSVLGSAALVMLPGAALHQAPGAPARVSPSDARLRMAFIGIGNRGGDMVKTFAATGLVNVAAFCDVDLDAAHTAESRTLFPAVPAFRNFRAMFDKMGAEFDAVVVATPDHSHVPAAMYAMRHGKHVYVEKPLAQTFREVDLLMAAAAKSGVVTQMGNQGHSGNNYFQFKAWTEAGIIRDVTKIVAFMNSPRRWHGWKVDGFPPGEPLPPGLDWDEWHAARSVNPFSTRLHPENWRGWFAYGTGAFGDWGAHILDTAHRFLRLGLPHTIEAVRLDGRNDFIFPQASTVRFDFAARPGMPPVEVFWHDGVDNVPPLPSELGAGATLTEKNGKFIYSKTLTFRGGTHGDTLRIIPEDRMREMSASLPKIGGGFSDHATNFVLACQGKEESRSPFHVSGPLTQVFLLGVIAQRVGGRLTFDPARREFVGHAAANQLLAGPPPRAAWDEYYR
jgi:predicted dehydrogenase